MSFPFEFIPKIRSYFQYHCLPGVCSTNKFQNLEEELQLTRKHGELN